MSVCLFPLRFIQIDGILLKFLEKFQIYLKSSNNNGHYRVTPKYILLLPETHTVHIDTSVWHWILLHLWKRTAIQQYTQYALQC